MTLSILNKEIRTVDGLFSLNDLHKASGCAEKHSPNRFTRLDTTKDLISEINQTPDMALALKSFRGGKTPGTYVCKELVYAYAMWISAKFSLIVIRTFDQLQQTQQPKLDDLSTVDSRVPLKDAVNKLVAVKKVNYSDAWKMVHQREGVEHAKELTEAQVQDALQYVHELTLSNVLEGELLPKQEAPSLVLDFDSAGSKAKVANNVLSLDAIHGCMNRGLDILREAQKTGASVQVKSIRGMQKEWRYLADELGKRVEAERSQLSCQMPFRLNKNADYMVKVKDGKIARFKLKLDVITEDRKTPHGTLLDEKYPAH